MKSIYGRLKQNTTINIQPANIIQYGFENSRRNYKTQLVLREPCNMVPMVRSKSFQQIVEILKLSAVIKTPKLKSTNNLYSLSMPQISSMLKCFCVHKNIELSWVNTSDTKLNPNDYEIFINPYITGMTDVSYYEYEYCSSFNWYKYN